MLLPLLQNNLLQGGSDVEVGADAASLTLATYAATISYDINVAVDAASLTLATAGAAVALDVAVGVSAASLTLATHDATVSYDVNVSAGAEALTLATYAATVDIGEVSVSVGTATLSLTTYAATIVGTDAVAAQATGGWLFLNFYEAEQQRRRAVERRRKELEEETERIEDDLDRNIAQLLREQEAVDDRKKDLDRLASLAKANADLEAARQYSERVAKAYERVLLQGNFSAIEALDRELQRADEEERFLLMAMVMVLDG